MRRPWSEDVMGRVRLCVGPQMSNSQAELQGHSRKDKSDQELHQRPNIPQSEGLGERNTVNTFSA